MRIAVVQRDKESTVIEPKLVFFFPDLIKHKKDRDEKTLWRI